MGTKDSGLPAIVVYTGHAITGNCDERLLEGTGAWIKLDTVLIISLVRMGQLYDSITPMLLLNNKPWAHLGWKISLLMIHA
jgi:hypothetical protein